MALGDGPTPDWTSWLGYLGYVRDNASRFSAIKALGRRIFGIMQRVDEYSPDDLGRPTFGRRVYGPTNHVTM
jgi:hypothetical protein